MLYTTLWYLDSSEAQKTNVFSFLLFFSILSVLDYLRFYEPFRYLIDLIIECLDESKTFFVVFIIIICSFSSAQIYKKKMEEGESEEWSVHDYFKYSWFGAFGDFAVTD